MHTGKSITVVIPAYNYAEYLGECIQSVLDQSLPSDEIIVVDDESTDNTKEICQQFPTVHYIWQKNKGLSSARNTGIREAKSDYIMCLDADDILRPDALKEHIALVDESSIAQCGLMYFGSETGTFRPQGATLETLLLTNTVYCNSVFPKKAWEEAGGFDESETMRLGLEDWLMWIEMAAKGYQVKTSNYIALLYRRHARAMTKQTTHPRWNEIIEYMSKKIKEKYNLETHFRPLK